MSRILIFDSGSGGLSIAEAILQQLPDSHLIYCADDDFFPYGLKDEVSIIERTQLIFNGLVDQFKPDIAVIACNTASTVSLPSLRDSFDFPIVGVVPAIKTAAQLSKTQHIALLATTGTVNRNYTQTLINSFANNCKTTCIGSSELVELAEDQLRLKDLSRFDLESILAPLKDTSIDTVVLGCTHFPLIKNILAEHLPHIKYWVDSGKAIANRVADLLTNQSTIMTDHAPNVYLYTQSKHAPCIPMKDALARFNLHDIRKFNPE